MPEPILIIDDEEAIRITFERFLSREGYGPIVTAANTTEALAAVRKHSFDLVICNIMIEGEEGSALLKQLRSVGVSCPVVVVTGVPDVDSAAEMLRMGAFDYISKPINKESLLRFVAQALRHQRLQKEKNRLESENEQYRRYLEAVFRSVQDVIITVDRDMNIVQFNDRAKQWIRNNETESGRAGSLVELSGEFAQACLDDATQVVNDRSDVSEHRIECRVPDGGNRLMSLNAAPINDEAGSFNGVVLVARDITTSGSRRIGVHDHFHGYTDSSPAMQEVYALIENVGKVDSTVLITGESGTGKELAADALHAESLRSTKPLIKVDCASIPEELLESELFGHKKGSFTGADRDRSGRILQADDGTLFLDEIGDITPRMQLRLLRFLQEQTFYPVGQDTPVQVDVRVITATNADLKDKVKKGLFREDLYYRLRVVEIDLPPLRARREGLPSLINHFLIKFQEKLGHNINSISDQAMNALISYSWPGNVRELQHVIERACVLCKEPTLSTKCLPSEIVHPVFPFSADLPSGDHDQPINDESPSPSQFVQPSHRVISPPSSTIGPDDILDALRRTGHNKAKAARLLGIHRTTLYRKMKRLNVANDAAIL